LLLTIDYLILICIILFMNILTSYKSNKNVIYSCKYHVVWCTKYRRDLLKNDVENDLKSIVFDLSKTMAVEVIELEVMPDHIHMLVEVDPQFGLHKFVKHIKGSSSRILREKHRDLRSRVPTLWTNSYFVSTVGGVTLDVVKKYIEDQKNV